MRKRRNIKNELPVNVVQVARKEVNPNGVVSRYEFYNVFKCPHCGAEIKERWGLDYRPRCRRKTPCCNQLYAMWAEPQHYTVESAINDSLHLHSRHFITAHKKAASALKRWQMANYIGGKADDSKR